MTTVAYEVGCYLMFAAEAANRYRVARTRGDAVA